MALFKGYVYFVEVEDLTTHIYRALLHNPADKQEIYVYPSDEGIFFISGRDSTFQYLHSR